MPKTHLTDDKLQTILDIARHAPSVHNTQPWLVQQAGDKLLVTLDNKYTLRDGDPTGRETVISLGIFADALAIGVEAVGLRVRKSVLEDKTVTISVVAGSTPSEKSHENVRLLRERCSDRSVYTPTHVAQQTVKDIENLTTKETDVRVVTDRAFMDTIADLTSKGIRLALSNPSFREELSDYLVEPWSRKKRGISVKSLYLSPQLEVLQPILVKLGIGLNAEAKLEKERWESASGIVIITGDGDMPHYWFEAGRAYLRASLEIEKAGLSQATSAAIVEASNFHEDVEQMLGTNQRILAMIRIGNGSKKRKHSPRVEADEILITLN